MVKPASHRVMLFALQHVACPRVWQVSNDLLDKFGFVAENAGEYLVHNQAGSWAGESGVHPDMVAREASTSAKHRHACRCFIATTCSPFCASSRSLAHGFNSLLRDVQRSLQGRSATLATRW